MKVKFRLEAVSFPLAPGDPEEFKKMTKEVERVAQSMTDEGFSTELLQTTHGFIVKGVRVMEEAGAPSGDVLSLILGKIREMGGSAFQVNIPPSSAARPEEDLIHTALTAFLSTLKKHLDVVGSDDHEGGVAAADKAGREFAAGATLESVNTVIDFLEKHIQDHKNCGDPACVSASIFPSAVAGMRMQIQSNIH